MNNFENIIKEIYFQIMNVKNNGEHPYYLLISEEYYKIMKNEIGNENKFDFFEELEIVHMPVLKLDYIEVKGIRLTNFA